MPVSWPDGWGTHRGTVQMSVTYVLQAVHGARRKGLTFQACSESVAELPLEKVLDYEPSFVS